MSRCKFQLLVVFCFIVSMSAFAQKGSIQGKVFDQSTQQPLVGANVVLVKTPLGASSDMDGQYVVEQVPVGVYLVEVTYMGYSKQTFPSVVVKTNRTTTLNVGLQMNVVEGEAVTVTAGYFMRNEENPVSVQCLNHEEIRRSPGAREDVSRML